MVRIAVIPGDGISHEIMPEAVKTLETAHELYEFALDYETYDFGAERYLKTGQAVPDDPDDFTAALPSPFHLALLAAGGVLAAVDAVLGGKTPNAFCAVRPPGHHASVDQDMGFCLINNVAIAARHVHQRPKLAKVLTVDWHVHLGNGPPGLLPRPRSWN